MYNKIAQMLVLAEKNTISVSHYLSAIFMTWFSSVKGVWCSLYSLHQLTLVVCLLHLQSEGNEVEQDGKPAGSTDQYEVAWEKSNDKAVEEDYEKELRVRSHSNLLPTPIPSLPLFF